MKTKHTPGGGTVLGNLGGIPVVAYPDQPAEKSKRKKRQAGGPLDPRDIKTPGVAERLNAERGAKYTIHPIALIFPGYLPQERAELKESIRQFGQFQPIVVNDGKVLDGRNRYEICLELGIEPKTIEFAEYKKAAKVNLSIAEFVFDSNVKRRHLTESQRAAIAAEFANMRQGERTDLEPSDNCLKVSQEEAARRFKVSAKSIGRAKKVKEKDPATFAKVKAGDVSLNAAVESLEPSAELRPRPAAKAPEPERSTSTNDDSKTLEDCFNRIIDTALKCPQCQQPIFHARGKAEPSVPFHQVYACSCLMLDAKRHFNNLPLSAERWGVFAKDPDHPRPITAIPLPAPGFNPLQRARRVIDTYNPEEHGKLLRSRAKRWGSALADAKDAVEELMGIQEAFSDWQANLPDNFRGGALEEKLDAVCDLSFDDALSVIEEAEQADLPLGFGKDG